MRRIVLMCSLVASCFSYAEWSAGLSLSASMDATATAKDTSAQATIDAGWQQAWQRQQVQLGYSAGLNNDQTWQISGNSNWNYQRRWLVLGAGHSRSLINSTNNILDTDTQLADSVNVMANFVAALGPTTQLVISNSATAGGESNAWPTSSSWQSGLSANRRLSKVHSASIALMRNQAFIDAFKRTTSTATTASVSVNRAFADRALALTLGNTWIDSGPSKAENLTASVNYSRTLMGLQHTWILQHGINQADNQLSKQYQASWQASKKVNTRFGWQTSLSAQQSEQISGLGSSNNNFNASLDVSANYQVSERTSASFSSQYQQQRPSWQRKSSAQIAGINSGISHTINKTLTVSGDFSHRIVLDGDADDSWTLSLSLRQQIR